MDWEAEIGHLLEDLSSAQQELLDVLGQKRTLLARGDVPGLAAVQERELSLVERLKGCQQRRAELLALARDEERPADSIATLAASLPGSRREKLGKQVKDSRLQMRLLQNETLTNWVLAQRLLLHVSQLVEIIATGGRLKPTYAEGDSSIHARGALVNDEA
ncbi:MAG TPA: flagellar export chaperone FlgN [Pirellulaceae bacterium]|nr:flagellar export chaperone FlgN [Pirellulaceae bacterium]